MDAPALAAALRRLRDAAGAVDLGLDLASAPAARAGRTLLVRQVDDYLLPRLERLDAPLLAVVGGSTGAGKSTLVNSVLGQVVSAPGVRRPTTRVPVLACAPGDVGWFSGPRVLPGLARTTGAPGPGAGAGAGLHLVATPALPAGVALLDAPDVDSVVAANRDLAAQLLAAADLWLFTTTAARYADAVPWELLRAAQQRATVLAVVLDRVPPDAVHEVAADLLGMLAAEGLGGAALFVVPETTLDGGLLPQALVAPLRSWLHGLGADAAARDAVVRTTLDGALASLDARVAGLLAAASDQRAARDALRAQAAAAYAAAVDEVADGVADGSLLRGEVLARWQEYVGTGEVLRTVQAGVARLRDRVAAALTGRPAPGAQVEQAVETGVAALVRAAADTAAERTARAWTASPGGAALLGASPDRSDPGLADRAAEEVRAWQGFVLDLVSRLGAGRRAGARVASYTVNGTGLAVMLLVFAHTGGLTGAEVAVAGGTSAAGQKVLEAMFGDQAVRSLAAKARADLLARVERLLASERARFDRAAAAGAAGPGGDPTKDPDGAPAGSVADGPAGRAVDDLAAALAAVRAARS